MLKRKEEYRTKEKNLYMFFVDLEKVFIIVSRKVVEWTMRRSKVTLKAMVKAVMNLYEEPTATTKVEAAYLCEFHLKVGVYIRNCFLFASVTAVVMEKVRKGLLH